MWVKTNPHIVQKENDVKKGAAFKSLRQKVVKSTMAAKKWLQNVDKCIAFEGCTQLGCFYGYLTQSSILIMCSINLHYKLNCNRTVETCCL